MGAVAKAKPAPVQRLRAVTLERRDSRSVRGEKVRTWRGLLTS